VEPLRDADLAPTWIAFARESTRQRVEEAYGLDLGAVWPVLLVLLPDEIYKRLASATATLLGRVQQWVLSTVAIGWATLLWSGQLPTTPRIAWTALFVLVWVLVAGVALRRVRSAAYEYFDLIESVVTAHRKLLYTGLGLTKPTGSDAEPDRGREVSEYLRLESRNQSLDW
jgi:hypothetical protein